MLRTLYIFSLLTVATSLVHAQQSPVHWSFSSVKVSDGVYDLVFHARIDQGWHLYGQHIEDGGPIPTSFTFSESGSYTLEEEVKESENVVITQDKIFEMEVSKFSGYAVFTQRIISSDLRQPITGYLTFMTCDNERCLAPLDVDFSFDLTAATAEKD